MPDNDSNEPILRHAGQQKFDRLGARAMGRTEKWQQRVLSTRQTGDGGEKKGPPGGFDATPIPHVAPGYTLKITFHKAENLPFADFGTFSSDPYIVATLKTGLTKRHKQDPELRIRIPTVRKNTNPEWNVEWVVANIPASGFFLKCRIYDEDPADYDDRLGNVHINVPGIGDNLRSVWAVKEPMLSADALHSSAGISR
jgi:C2 domain